MEKSGLEPAARAPNRRDLAESMKHSASDRLGDLVPQIRARTSPWFFTAWRFLALVLKLSFNVLRVLLNSRSRQCLPGLFPSPLAFAVNTVQNIHDEIAALCADHSEGSDEDGVPSLLHTRFYRRSDTSRHKKEMSNFGLYFL